MTAIDWESPIIFPLIFVAIFIALVFVCAGRVDEDIVKLQQKDT
jgi:hypothetical protein